MNRVLRYFPLYPIFFIFYIAVKNGGIYFKRLPLFLVYLARYIFFEPFRLLEYWFFHWRIRYYRLEHPPVFILGHWRSGTSHLQNLVSRDEHTTTSSIYTSLNPDSALLTQFWIKPLLNFICKVFGVKYSIQRTQMSLDLPAELDLALCSMCSPASYTWAHLFPERFEGIADEKIFFPNERAENNWLADYDFLIRKLAFTAGGKQVIVKSPGDTARIASLLKKYPDAKLIYIHRDPLEVFLSSRYLWSVILKENALQAIDQAQADKLIIETYRKLLTAYLDQRASIPGEQLMEISFRDLHNDPAGTMKSIYEKFGMKLSDDTALQSLIAKNKSYRAVPHAVEPELENKLRTEWEFAFREWNY